MKRRVSKLLALLAVLILTISIEPSSVLAKENVIEQVTTAEDMEINLADTDYVEVGEILTMEELAVEVRGNETALDINDEVQAVNAEDETEQTSITRYGSVSGYLLESGDFELYSLNLSADEYLQAKLTVPNNSSINYALALYDSELNVIKSSHYIPYLNGGKALEESVGYLPASDELIYIGVLSFVGGSETEPYTLDFSITTNYSILGDTGEPNENVQEAATLTLDNSGANVSGMLNTAIDNDWYSFTVIDSPKYDKIRLGITSTSVSNGCMLEIYRNLTDDYYTMVLCGSGAAEGELDLPVGTYYVRVVSTNTFSDFNPGDLPVYNLSVVPVSRVDEIEITVYEGPKGVTGFWYPEGGSYRLFDAESNWIDITGWAYYTDSMGNKFAAENIKLNGTVVNTSWESLNRPDLSTTYGTAVTRSNGFFTMRVYLNRSKGLRQYHGDFYDYMRVEICDSEKCTAGFFYLIDSYITH